MVVLDEKMDLPIVATDYEYANFGERLIARFIDGLIVVIPSLFVPFILPWLYYALQESSESGATIGKRIMGIRVVDYEGQRIGFGTATGRFFANFLNLFTLFIGYFLMLFNSRSQCLHDMITGTVVIKAQPSRQTRRVETKRAQPRPAALNSGKSWRVSQGADVHYVRLDENGGQYIHTSAEGDYKSTFTLWQLADGRPEIAEAFGETVYAEMRQFAEAEMVKLAQQR